MNNIYVLIGIFLPFLLTSFGSSLIFVLKKDINNNIKKLLIGLSIGVMLSSSIFSLLIPSIELSKTKWLTPSIGVMLGFLFLIIINKITNKNINMTMFSVTLHNIPEGMVVGASFASALFLKNVMSIQSAFIISLGIALQNIPEGSIISISYKLKEFNKLKSFLMGVLSGIVEPIFALLTVIFFKRFVFLLPYLLSFSFGAMIFVIIDELSIELNKNKSVFGLLGVMIGFIIMMVLDISFG